MQRQRHVAVQITAPDSVHRVVHSIHANGFHTILVRARSSNPDEYRLNPRSPAIRGCAVEEVLAGGWRGWEPIVMVASGRRAASPPSGPWWSRLGWPRF